jgi:hypothetical protein
VLNGGGEYGTPRRGMIVARVAEGKGGMNARS